MPSRFLLVGLLLATLTLVALASNPGPLQDFCVADNSSKVLVNGCVCKDPKMVKAEDFLFSGLDKMGDTIMPSGSLLVGFVTFNTDNKLFTKRLEKGDVFVFPEGLIHFQQNVGNGYAVAIAGLSSQNPGVITIANAVFGSNPDISDDILAKAFQVDKKNRSVKSEDTIQKESSIEKFPYISTEDTKPSSGFKEQLSNMKLSAMQPYNHGKRKI
ncbi:putative germin-like protein 2-1 [Tanacetum coccineum]